MSELISSRYITDDVWAVVYNDGGIAAIGMSEHYAKKAHVINAYDDATITNDKVKELWPTIKKEQTLHVVQLESTYTVKHNG